MPSNAEKTIQSRQNAEMLERSLADLSQELMQKGYFDNLKVRVPAREFFRKYGRPETYGRVAEDLRENGIDIESAEVNFLDTIAPILKPGEFESLSKSKRVTHAINVYRPGEQAPCRQYYTKIPNTAEEPQRSLIAMDAGLGPKVLLAESIPFGGDEDKPAGMIIEERMERGGSLMDRGRYLDQGLMDEQRQSLFGKSEVEILGERLAEKVDTMVNVGLLYDFSHNPDTHIRLKGRGAKMDLVLLDWSNSRKIDVSTMDYETAKEMLASQIKYLIRLFHTKPPHSKNHLALRAFDRRLRELGNQTTGTVRLGGQTASIKKTLYDEALDRTRAMLVTGTDVSHRTHMRRLYDYAEGKLTPDKTDYTEREAAIHDKTQLIYQRLEESGVPWVRDESMARAIAQNILDRTNLDEFRAYDFKTYHSQSNQQVYLKVHSREKEWLTDPPLGLQSWGEYAHRRGGLQYRMRVCKSEREAENLTFAGAQGLSPCIMRIEKDEKRVLAEVLDHDTSIDLCGPLLSRVESAKVGTRLAMKLAMMTREGERLPYCPRDYPKQLLLPIDQRGIDVLFAPWVKTSDSSDPKWHDQVVGHIRGIASVCRQNIAHGDIAWKRFETCLREEAPIEAPRMDFFSNAIDQAKQSLTSGGQENDEWAAFFEKAKTATYLKPKRRKQQTTWIELLERDNLSRCVPTTYSTATLKKAKGLDKLITLAVEHLVKSGKVDDVQADASHVHVFIPDERDAELRVKLGLEDLRAGYIVFDLYQVSRRKSTRPFKAAAFRFSSKTVLGEVGYFQTMADFRAEHRDLVDPPALRGYIVDGTTRRIGGESVGVWWDRTYFGQMPASMAVKRVADLQADDANHLKRELEMERAWMRFLTITRDSYTNWHTIISRCKKAVDDQNPGAEPGITEAQYNLVVGLERDTRKNRPFGLTAIADPNCERIVDFSPQEPGPGFGFYKQYGLEELLDKTIENCNPDFTTNIKKMLRAQEVMDKVRAAEIEAGKPLDDRAVEEIAKQVNEPQLAGNKPSDYITNVVFMQNGSNYVVEMEVMLKDGQKRKLIVKHTDILAEAYMSILGAHCGIRTPFVRQCDQNYGLQSICPGTRFADLTPETVQTYAQDIYHILGHNFGVSGIFGDGHDKNTFLVTGDIAANWRGYRIDTEHRTCCFDIGEAGYLYEANNAENTLKGLWMDPLQRFKHWPFFQDGILSLSTILHSNGGMQKALEVLEEMRKDPRIMIPEGTPEADLQKTKRHQYQPEEIDEYKRRLQLTPDQLEGRFNRVAVAVEDIQMASYPDQKNLLPRHHLIHINTLLEQILPENGQIKPEEILSTSNKRTNSIKAYLLGMTYAVETLLGDVDVTYEGEIGSLSPGVRAAVRRLSMFGLPEKMQKNRAENWVKQYVISRELMDKAAEERSQDTTPARGRIMAQIKKMTGERASLWEVNDMIGAYAGSRSAGENDLRDFIDGANLVMGWVRESVNSVAKNARRVGIDDANAMRERIKEPVEDNLREALEFMRENALDFRRVHPYEQLVFKPAGYYLLKCSSAERAEVAPYMRELKEVCRR
ncbi:MAG: hypothetical protein V1875_05980 [Candidatus Altiarchaeota archaeon]